MKNLRTVSIVLTIIGVVLFPMMILALILKVNGVNGPIQLGSEYYEFFNGVSMDLNSWDNIKIPNIPSIPKQANVDGWRIITIMINFFNFIISFLNIIVNIINFAIYIIKFIIALMKAIIDTFPKIFTRGTDDSSMPYPISYWYTPSHRSA